MTRFRFTLRELFLLVLVVAVCLAWWVDHRRMSVEHRSHIQTLHSVLDSEQHYIKFLGEKIEFLLTVRPESDQTKDSP